MDTRIGDPLCDLMSWMYGWMNGRMKHNFLGHFVEVESISYFLFFDILYDSKAQSCFITM